MKTVAISILGTNLDRRGRGDKRWNKWRPTVSLCQQDDLIIDKLVLLFEPKYQSLADQLSKDIAIVSPETEVNHHHIQTINPWDFETVYSALYDFSQNYNFKPETEEYLVHITTGTHVAQICLYLLTETHYIPGKLVQTSPSSKNSVGLYQVIDLDLSKYDQIASRFQHEHFEGTSYLKHGIETKSKLFNNMIEQLEKVSVRSQEPILITGPTGAGKTQLAKKIFELKKQRDQLSGNFVVVNCATLKGENAMSALFGHTKGAFTGAATSRKGLLLEADKGLLFLDEIGELGTDEQSMLLRAIEERAFLPFGSDKEVSSDFQLIAGTNRNLSSMIEKGLFREDLLARINLWTYQLPSLKQRMEDFEPNLDYELTKFADKAGHLVSFNKVARSRYLSFALSSDGLWTANFRDLNSSITRMATLSDGGRISLDIVDEEIERLKEYWQATRSSNQNPAIKAEQLLGINKAKELDLFEQIQIVGIAEVCRQSQSMAEAGRKLFGISRLQKKTTNDSHRLKQLLAKFDITFNELQ